MCRKVVTAIITVYLLVALRSIQALQQKPAFKPSSFVAIRRNIGKAVGSALTKNPLTLAVVATYSFFWSFPRRNLPYERPWEIFKNDTVQLISWYQFPHNLPPYRLVGDEEFGYPEDFFCFGLPGNTLPMGNWDPFYLQNTSPRVLRKYRESELKHGRLAMLAAVGILVSENYHPLRPNVGGLAITHMEQILHTPAAEGMFKPLYDLLATLGIQVNADIPLDYIAIILALSFIEYSALLRNWDRWRNNEYKHQFEGNIGVGNLKADYENGNYGFDPLRFRPEDPADFRDMQDAELNHCRLAMVAALGMIIQEYVTGLPCSTALAQWLDSGGLLEVVTSPVALVEAIVKLPVTVGNMFNSVTQSLGGGIAPPPPVPSTF